MTTVMRTREATGTQKPGGSHPASPGRLGTAVVSSGTRGEGRAESPPRPTGAVTPVAQSQHRQVALVCDPAPVPRPRNSPVPLTSTRRPSL